MIAEKETMRKSPRPETRPMWLLSNGPSLITVVASAGIAILATVVDFSTRQLLQAVLALLALIGTSLVTERLIEGRKDRARSASMETQMTELLTRMGGRGPGSLDNLILSRRNLAPLEERLAAATRVSISGGSLLRLANEYGSLFESLIAEGCTFRFVMTDPESQGAEFLSNEISYESRSPQTYCEHMRDSLAGLKELTKKYPGLCEVRTFASAPPFSLVVIESGKEVTSQLELYTLGIPARDRPMLTVTSKGDPRLCELFAISLSGFGRAI